MTALGGWVGATPRASAGMSTAEANTGRSHAGGRRCVPARNCASVPNVSCANDLADSHGSLQSPPIATAARCVLWGLAPCVSSRSLLSAPSTIPLRLLSVWALCAFASVGCLHVACTVCYLTPTSYHFNSRRGAGRTRAPRERGPVSRFALVALPRPTSKMRKRKLNPPRTRSHRGQ